MRMRLTLACALAPLLACALPARAAPASAVEAAAPWPESAQGRPLPRPSWVLVIPARRKPGGGLVIWDRTDAWTKAWRVPRLVRGMRMVTVLGDAEDRRSVTAEAIDGMVVDSLSVVMRKYGAPALALAVTDGHEVALAGYVPGYAASWLPAEADQDAEKTRERSLATLATLFNAKGGSPQAQAAVPPAGPPEAEILAVRDRDDGGFDYRLKLNVADEAGARRLIGGAGMRLEGVEGAGGGTLVAVVSSPDDVDGLTESLKARGVTVR